MNGEYYTNLERQLNDGEVLQLDFYNILNHGPNGSGADMLQKFNSMFKSHVIIGEVIKLELQLFHSDNEEYYTIKNFEIFTNQESLDGEQSLLYTFMVREYSEDELIETKVHLGSDIIQALIDQQNVYADLGISSAYKIKFMVQVSRLPYEDFSEI